jgi:hypothetical protein
LALTYDGFNGYNVAKEGKSATTVEKLTLKPHAHEIIVNTGATEGAIDLFSYAPDEAAAQPLGSLYVIGHRDVDSSNMGYMVSLIAALARREYYAQPGVVPREAFSRTLRKANEVVEEFFRNDNVKLSVGIVAVAGGTIMVSKLDKFKIFLARENQVIDILDNVLLFSKEHSEKRKFSSIIHGSVQAGDRILAFVPTRAITAREKHLKGWFLKLPQAEFVQQVTQVGTEHATFAATMLHIDMTQTSEPTEPVEIPVVQPVPAPALAWAPRQQPSSPQYTEERPRLIPSEFSRGTRSTPWSRWFKRIKVIRLDQRGKAIALGVIVTLVVVGTLAGKSLLFTSPQQRAEQQALQNIQKDVDLAKSKVSQNDQGGARQLLSKAWSALMNLGSGSGAAKTLQASIASAIDAVDNAQAVSPTLLASPQPDSPVIALSAFASSSQTIWVGGTADGTFWAAPVSDQTSRVSLGATQPTLLVGWNDSVLAIDPAARTIARLVNGSAQSYTIPTQDAVLDAAEFNKNLYVLTDKSILKISDLDTQKPVTKQWLSDTTELATGAAHLWVDSNVWTMSADGTLTTYYKGKKQSQASTTLTLSGTWRLVSGPDGLLAVPSGDLRRIYLISPTDGSLVRTLKLDSDAPYTYLSPGPDNSVLLITKEGKLWQVK